MKNTLKAVICYLIVAAGCMQASAQDLNWLKSAPPEILKANSKFGVDLRDTIYSVKPTNNGNLLVSGSVVEKKNFDALVFEMSADNQIIWSYTEPVPKEQQIYDSVKMASGSIFAVGRTRENKSKAILVVKLNSQGELQWRKTFGGEKEDIAYRVFEAPQGGLLIVGETSSGEHGKSDIKVIKISEAGILEWQKDYGGSGKEEFIDATITSQNNIIMLSNTGSSFEGGTNSLVTIIKPDGAIISERTYLRKQKTLLSSVFASKNGYTYLATFKIKSGFMAKSYQPQITAIDKNGIETFSKDLGVGVTEFPSQLVMADSLDGGVYLSSMIPGYSTRETWIAKLDANAELLWQSAFEAPLTNVVKMTVPEIGKLDIYGFNYRDEIGEKLQFQAYPTRLAQQEGRKQRQLREAQSSKNSDDWGQLLGQVVKHGTGAVIASGAVDDIEAVGALTAVNAYAGLATGDSVQSIEAEQKGLIDSHLQKREEQQQFTADLNSQVNQIKQQQQSLADENQRLKLELENARMKAELARLRGQQSSQPVATPSKQNRNWNTVPQNITIDASPQIIGNDGSIISSNSPSVSQYSGFNASGVSQTASLENVSTHSYAVCYQTKARIIRDDQRWICHGTTQKLSVSEETLDEAIGLSGCKDPQFVADYSESSCNYIFSCSSPQQGYDNDILSKYNLAGRYSYLGSRPSREPQDSCTPASYEPVAFGLNYTVPVEN